MSIEALMSGGKPKNAFIWGFILEFVPIIESLLEKGVIESKFWITEPLPGHAPGHPSFHYVWPVLLGSFINDPAYEYEKYGGDAVIPEKIYNNIHQHFDVFYEGSQRLYIEYQDKEYWFHPHLFNLHAKYFYGILTREKIEVVLFSNIPHMGADYVLFLLAKELSIPTIIISQCPHLYDRILYMWNIEDYGEFSSFFARESDYSLDGERVDNLFWGKKINESFSRKRILRNAISRNMKDTVDKMAMSHIKIKRSREYLKLSDGLKQAPDLEKNFIYFPLHLQPELSTMPLGGDYFDQLLAQERLSFHLPGGGLSM